MKSVASLVLFLALIQHPYHSAGQSSQIPSSIFADTRRVNALAEAGNVMWVATSGGLVRLDKATREFKVFTPSNSGLQTLAVSALLSDSNGVLWAGTGYNRWIVSGAISLRTPPSGLYQYDGTTWQHFDKSQCPALGSSIWAIERQGNYLWVGTENGLCRYDGQSWTLYKKTIAGKPAPTDSALPDNTVLSLHTDVNGVLWIGTLNGLVRYNPDGTWESAPLGTWSNPAGLPVQQVNSIVSDPAGNIWIATFNGLGRFNKDDYTILDKFNVPTSFYFWLPTALSIDASGLKWLGTNRGMLTFDDVNWNKTTADASVPQTNYIGEVLVASDQTVWCGIAPNSPMGLYYFQNQQWSNANISPIPLSDIFGTLILPAISDPVDKTIWLGDSKNGVLNYNNGSWNVGLKLTSLGEKSDGVTSVVLDAQGKKWLSAGSSIYQSDNGGWKKYDLSSNLDFPGIYLFPGKKQMLFGAYNRVGAITPEGGLQLSAGPNPGPFNGGKNGTSVVDIMVEGANQDVWAATETQLSAFNDNTGVVNIKDGVWKTFHKTETNVNVNSYFFYTLKVKPSLVIDPKGAIWTGSSNGAARFDGSTWTHFISYNSTFHSSGNPTLPSSNILCMYAEPSGAVWAGTDAGVARFKDGNWTIFTKSNSSLPSDTVFSITSSKNSVWLGTSAGLVRIKNDIVTKIDTPLPYPDVINVQADTVRKSLYLQSEYSTFTIIDGILCDVPAPAITASGPLAFCEGKSVTLSGPAGALSYEWSTGETTSSITVTKNAQVKLRVTDGGCVSTWSDEISISLLSNPQSQISGKNSFCDGSSTTLAGPEGVASYEWSTGETTSTINVKTDAQIKLRVTDSQGCVSTWSDEVAVVKLPNPPPVIDGKAEFCYGDNTVLNGPAGFSEYSWSTGATTQSITLNASATVNLVVKSMDGCISPTSDNVVISEREPISVELGGDKNIYSGYAPAACATINASVQAASYTTSWNTGEVSNSINVCPLMTTSYTATIKDDFGCTAQDSVVVNVTSVSCDGNKVMLCHHTASGSWEAWCVPAESVAEYLAGGDYLGSCTGSEAQSDTLAAVNVSVVPNPVLEKASIVVTASTAGYVQIEILNNIGQVIATPFSGPMNANEEYRYDLSGKNGSGGLYFCVVTLNGKKYITKFLLL